MNIRFPMAASIACLASLTSAQGAAQSPAQLDPSAIVTLRIDPTQLTDREIRSRLVELVDVMPAIGQRLRGPEVDAVAAAVAAAGVESAYLQVSAESFQSPCILLKFHEAAAPNALQPLVGLLGQGRNLDVRLEGEIALLGKAEAVQRAGLSAEQRRRWSAAFRAGQGAALQLVVMLDADDRRVIAELGPRWPEPFAALDRRTLGSLQWLSLSVLAEPQLAVKLDFRAESAAAGRRLAEEIKHVHAALAADPRLNNALPELRSVLDTMQPRQQSALVTLRIGEDGALLRLRDAVKPLLARSAAGVLRQQNSNNLKQIMLAMHNYYDVHKRLPRSTSTSDGRPLLSWRVHILPFLEQQALYAKFRLDEPWDSDHNRALVAEMPDVYRTANRALEPGKTAFLAMAGPGMAFEPQKKIEFRNVSDGASNTAAVADAAAAVTWTKPDDFVPPPEGIAKGLHATKGTFMFAFLDGSVRTLDAATSDEELRALFTIAGGEE